MTSDPDSGWSGTGRCPRRAGTDATAVLERRAAGGPKRRFGEGPGLEALIIDGLKTSTEGGPTTGGVAAQNDRRRNGGGAGARGQSARPGPAPARRAFPGSRNRKLGRRGD